MPGFRAPGCVSQGRYYGLVVVLVFLLQVEQPISYPVLIYYAYLTVASTPSISTRAA